jgi:hypothetical protein
MGVNRKDTKADWIDPNEIPDLSTDDRAKVINTAPPQIAQPEGLDNLTP